MSHVRAEQGAVDPVVLGRRGRTLSKHLAVEAALAEVVIAVAAIKIGGPQSCQMELRRSKHACVHRCMQQKKQPDLCICKSADVVLMFEFE